MTQTEPRPATAAVAADIAAQHGMSLAGARAPLGRYVLQLWGRRHFIVSFTRATNSVTYSDSLLGQAWQILTPLLNAAVYYLIFGVLLNTKRGTPNFIAYLTVGIFVFSFMQRSIIAGSRSVNSNLGLIRSLHFPRATLPLGSTAVSFQQLLISLTVMLPVVLLTGEPIRWTWLLVAPAIVLEGVFTLGASFAIARIGARVPDTTQLLPFLLRTWLYLSGIFYSIDRFTRHHGEWVRLVLTYNPGAVYPELVRSALLVDQRVPFSIWVAGFVWAVVMSTVGLVYFWQAEESYGRG